MRKLRTWQIKSNKRPRAPYRQKRPERENAGAFCVMATTRRAGRLKKLAARIENGMRIGLILSGKLVSQRATRKAPRDTGRLKRSIKEGKPYKVRKTALAIDIGTKVSYARAHELGSGLFAEKGPKKKIEIRPDKKKALAFFWPNAPAGLTPSASGKFVFGKVMHPGIKPTPYLRPALKESTADIKKIILASVVGALKKQ